LANGKKANKMERENLLFQVPTFMMEIGKTGKCMEMELMNLMELKSKVNGNMEISFLIMEKYENYSFNYLFMFAFF